MHYLLPCCVCHVHVRMCKCRRVRVWEGHSLTSCMVSTTRSTVHPALSRTTVSFRRPPPKRHRRVLSFCLAANPYSLGSNCFLWCYLKLFVFPMKFIIQQTDDVNRGSIICTLGFFTSTLSETMGAKPS